MAFRKENKIKSNFSKITIGLASPEEILENSSGEVLKPETINYRTYKPERDGLFCERIFGPIKDYECHCGKYKRIRYKGIVCDRCGVEVTEKKVRRERMGHIHLVVPVAHIWYFRSLPNKIGYLLGLPTKKLDSIIYYERYVVIQPGCVDTVGELDLLSEEEYLDILDSLPRENQLLEDTDPNKFIAKIGAEAVYDLLARLDLDSLSYELRHRANTDTSQQRKNEALGDNTDIIVMRQGLELIRKKLIGVLAKLAHFAKEYKDMPCMAYTHCQPAQPTTVGKRATLWANELVMDLNEIDHRLATLQLRGVKGTTGTQASFMELFKGDADKIRAVDASIAEEMGFDREAVIPVSGQTYSRKVDAFILNALAGIAQSCMKFATDLRLLANFKEMEEPFEKNQIGSSAMPYKRNPMRCERICALARYLMVDVLNPSITTGTQWFERTLDDSANKRIAMAEGFLAADAILNIMLNVTDGIVVYPKVIRSRLMAELPFMASENIMMQAVEKGGNRQELHERLRQHAIAAGKQVKEEGLPNDMVDRVAADPAFGLTKEEIVAGLVPENFVGRAPQQVDEFIAHILKPIFDANPDAVEQHASLSV